MEKIRAFGATVFFCLTLWAMPASAQGRGPFMTVGMATSQPIGHKMFCRTHVDECRPAERKVMSAPADPVELSAAVILSIAAINTAVNGTVKARSDMQLYGVEEKWTYPNGSGDCEDFALQKRRVLVENEGIAPGNLLMTVVRKHDGEGHAVLTLRTTRGDFILDNLDWRIRPWGDVSYTFVKRQSTANPGVWIEIDDHAQLLVGAVEK